jgi:integrase
MASAFVTRIKRGGNVRFRVRYRIGGCSTPMLSGGTFKTRREANLRRDWIAGELAAKRFPDLSTHTTAPLTFGAAADRWLGSRRDVADGTRSTYHVALGRLRPRLQHRPLAELTPTFWNELIGELAALPLARDSIRKTLSVAAMILDHEQVEPNPVRSPLVKLPRAEKRIVAPPTAAHVLAVHGLLPSRYRLPLVVLEATGMRIGELQALTWGDVDEPRRRWRIAEGKTGAATRWVTPPTVVLDAVLALCPLDDRAPTRPLFQGFSADRFRTALARAATAAGVPVFSPHDLRHRRVSMLHAAGVSWAKIGEQVGHADLVTTARTYTHVVADEAELDYLALVT